MDNQVENPIRQEPDGDVDQNGRLALALFAGVIVAMLVVIFALAQAA